MRDENQIAFGILRTLMTTVLRRIENAAPKPARARGAKDFWKYGSQGGRASVAAVPPEQRRANGLKGAIARWGTIKERDNHIMPTSRKNLDVSQLAKRILDEATGDEPKTEPPVKNQAAVELGRLGGKKGGAARKTALSPERRKEIAKHAAESRWKQ